MSVSQAPEKGFNQKLVVADYGKTKFIVSRRRESKGIETTLSGVSYQGIKWAYYLNVSNFHAGSGVSSRTLALNKQVARYFLLLASKDKSEFCRLVLLAERAEKHKEFPRIKIKWVLDNRKPGAAVKFNQVDWDSFTIADNPKIIYVNFEGNRRRH